MESGVELPSAARLALMCGVKRASAQKRLLRYRRGEIDERKLYAGRQADSRKVEGGRCPVTGGHKTGMSAAAFAAICEANLRECRFGKRRGALELRISKYRFSRCQWCEGRRENWPPELKVTDGREM